MSLVEIGSSDLSSLTTAQLEDRLASALGRTAEGIAEMAACVRELESRGEDLARLKLAIMPYLRRIAQGQLLPQVVVSYAGSRQLLDAIASLPLSDQQHLLDVGTVKVAVVEADGMIGAREIDPRALPPRDIARVFSPAGLRPPTEQLALPRTSREGRRYSVRVDKQKRRVLVGRMSVPIAEVLTALAEAAGYGGEIPAEDFVGRHKAHTPLTDGEKERLVAMAKATGVSETEIVRRAILTWLI